ncbi:MAG TPA: TonB-dependent receptor, partial [Paludibacter sp.]|nr:TonB-dependent receptor [Paludibacter sp.]
MCEKKSLFFLLLMSFSPFIFAQNGSISGKIIDAQNQEPLIGASVVLNGTTIGNSTNLDGNYNLQNIRPGTYALTVSYISYQTTMEENIVVEADKTTSLTIPLKPADFTLTEMEVVARANRESETILLMEQRKALIATQAVSAREMSRKGVSNAESAVTKVSGISKQNGVKNVFVRGLGDRYNNTTLNGFPIPSEDPEYKNIALDFFGTDVIQSIGV